MGLLHLLLTHNQSTIHERIHRAIALCKLCGPNHLFYIGLIVFRLKIICKARTIYYVLYTICTICTTLEFKSKLIIENFKRLERDGQHMLTDNEYDCKAQRLVFLWAMVHCSYMFSSQSVKKNPIRSQKVETLLGRFAATQSQRK